MDNSACLPLGGGRRGPARLGGNKALACPRPTSVDAAQNLCLVDTTGLDLSPTEIDRVWFHVR